MQGRRWNRHIGGALLALMATFAIVAPVLSLAAATQAEAQERRGRTLFDLLFNRNRDRAEPEPERAQPRARRQASPQGSASRPAEPRAATPPPVEKSADAKTVLVIGDFMAGGLADGLDAAYAQNAGVSVVSRANGSSGFVRDDYYDWPSEIGGILDEVEPAIVAVMLGSNDRQQMALDGQRLDVRSEAWTQHYQQRVAALAQAVRSRGLPLIWVGLPSFKPGNMSADMLAFNDIYRAAAEEVDGDFVDIWDGFVDENGVFTTIGPDMNGQRVRLRAADGINMTAAGKRKIAFYAERALERYLGSTAGAGIAALPGSGEPFGPAGPIPPSEIERTPPIALGGPALDGGTQLMGGARPANDGEARTPAEKLARDGNAPDPKPGRADDFGMRRLAAEPAPDDVTATTAIPSGTSRQ